MKRIGLSQLIGPAKDKSYEVQYKLVMDKLNAGQVKPVRASGKNGKKPALYYEYWIIEEKTDYKELEDELKFQLLPMIQVDYYMAHLETYEKDRKWVLMMNEYLKHNKEALRTMESMNERSFEIWRREKFLKEEQGKRIMKRMGISHESLNLYETTEPLSYYSHTKKTPQNILIIENKDTFYSMRRLLLGGRTDILSMETGTLIYGAGKGILRSFRDFALCVEPYMNSSNNQIYYFGDLDYEGIGIYENLYHLFEEKCRILPMKRAYLTMLDKVTDIEGLPDTKEGQVRRECLTFLDYFAFEDRLRIEEVLTAGKYIPQEILSMGDL